MDIFGGFIMIGWFVGMGYLLHLCHKHDYSEYLKEIRDLQSRW